MKKKILKHGGLIGLTLIAFMLVIGWGNHAYANDTNEARIDQEVRVDPHLLSELAKDETTGYLIYFRERADLSPAFEMSWEERGYFVMNRLQEVAERTQPQVRAYLDRQGAIYQAFWIDNVIAVNQSDMVTFNGLLDFSEIEIIVSQPEVILFEPEVELDGPEILAIEPNIDHVLAPDVWAMGVTGAGIVVASIDTGVRYTHNALVEQYRGNLGGGFSHDYHWWNPYESSAFPSDSHDHGSHVTGTMVGDDGGDNQIGMAPDAKWIACRGFNPGATSAGLLECGEFIAAPWDLDGLNPDPMMRPHAVNNSWGSCTTSYDPWYQGVVDAWVAAGIYPAFANGNASNCGYPSPPGLNTVGNPARYGNVSGVGSTGTSNGEYAPHSNWGPTDDPDTINPNGYPFLKPQFVAPGVSIRSSFRASDTAYGLMSGTSMSSPHVAGLVALMWQAAPCLIGEYGQTETIIQDTATPIPYDTGNGDEGPGNVPNHATGWGEINSLGAVQAAIGYCGPSGTITGEVTDASTGDPLADAAIEAVLTITQTKSATTDNTGVYTMTFAPEGAYTVTAELFGYLPGLATDVEVISGTVTVQDFALTAAPSHTVSGQVTDSTTGWPLYASIEIEGSPYTIWTDPVDGSYSVTLPAGIEYEFVVNAWVSGYDPEARAVGPLTDDATEDFGLQADLLSCSAPGYSFDYFYYENFVADDGGFTIEGTSPAPWQWGEPVTWPGECIDGATCWGTNLNGNYNNNADESIVSPVIDLTAVNPGTPLAVRWHQAWHIESATWDQAYAEVSIDGGPWEVMWEHTGSTIQVPWTEMDYDLSAAAGGEVQFRFRFTTDSSVNFNGYYIDAIGIVAGDDCQPQAGGLVVGNVYDDNTADPLVGALIASDSGEAVVAVDTPADPDVDAAFYTIFAPEGSNVLTATIGGGYGPDTATVIVNDGETVHQNFWLPAGWIDINPEAMDVTVEFGAMATYPLTLTNYGALPADFVLSTSMQQHFEGDFPPDGWSVIDNGGNCVWQRNDHWPRPNYAGGDGFSAAADSDACGSGTTMDTELHTPVFDLIGATSASLDFVASYRHLSASSFMVDISPDGGDSWDNLLTWTESVDPQGPGSPVSLDLTPYVGMSNLVVRFYYSAPGWHWWAQVDQVQIIADGSWIDLDPSNGILPASGGQEVVDVTFDATEVPEPGQYVTAIVVEQDTPYVTPPVDVTVNVIPSADMGLLDGYVYSEGYCDADPFPAAGANVLIESDTNTWNRAADENGYYFFYVNAGQSPLTVTVSAPVHETGIETDVIITAGMTTTVDFDLRWLVPCITVSPETLSVTVESGDSETVPFTIYNDGGGDADFEIRKRDGGYGAPLAGGYVPEPQVQLPGYDPLAMSAEGLFAPRTQPAFGGILDAGDILASWPSGHTLPWGTGFNLDDEMVWVNDNAAGGGTGLNEEFTVDGVLTGKNFTPNFGGSWPGDMAYNPNTGMFWQVNVGGDNCVYEWDPAVPGPTGNSICGAWTWTSQRGVAYNAEDDTFFIGGWNDSVVYEVDAAGATVQTCTMNLAISGLAYNWEAGLLFAMLNASPNTIEVIDWGTCSVVDSITVEGGAFGGFSGAGMGIDCDGNLWAANQGDQYVYLIDSGVPASLCATDVPWLSEDPSEGSVPADDFFDVQITFTAFPTMPLGVYTATMTLLTNDPVNDRIDVPVTMVVEGDPVYNPTLTPAADAAAGDPGEVVVYELTVANMGNSPDTISLSLSGNEWDAELSADSVGLLPGETMDITVEVTISADALAGETDVVTVTAVSDNDPNAMSSSELTTTANAVYGLAMSAGETALNGYPGETVHYTITLTNTGNAADDFTIAGSGHTWDADHPAEISLDAGDATDLVVSVTIPDDAAGGATDHLLVTITSDSDSGHSASMTLSTTANNVYGVELSPAMAAQTGLVGEVVTYTLTITNTGNAQDSFGFTAVGGSWEVGLPMTITLGMGQSAEVMVTVEIPASAAGGATDTVTVTAASVGDETVIASSELTTTAEVDEYILYLPIILKP